MTSYAKGIAFYVYAYLISEVIIMIPILLNDYVFKNNPEWKVLTIFSTLIAFLFIGKVLEKILKTDSGAVKSSVGG